MSEPQTLHELFAHTVETWPHRPFFRYDGETVCYETAAAETERRAAFLYDCGVQPDDRVGLLSPNGPEFLYLLFAAARVGATFVPLNHRQEGPVLEYLLNDADVTTLVVDGAVADRYCDVRNAVNIESVFFHDGPDAERDYDVAVNSVDLSDAPTAVHVTPTDVAVLSYTSGTTGPPKGVENPHLSYVDAGRRIATACKTDETSRGLLVLPLFHANPMTYGLMHMLAVGGSIVLVREFSASDFFERARSSNSTFFTHVGSILEILQRTLDQNNVDPTSPLKFAIGGAAQFTRQQEFEKQTGAQLIRLYGLSELGAGMVTIAPYDADETYGHDHQGRFEDQPFDVRILAADNVSFADEGERGEILVRPDRPGLMFQGYRGKPGETVEAWQDLWMHTGDIGKIRNGRLYYVGREKTNIRKMGENVSPWEVESAFEGWDRVAEAVAVGVPDEVAGEEVGLLVVPADDYLTEGMVYERCRDRLATQLRPRYISFLEQVPRTSTHKIERSQLQEQSLADAWDACHHL